MLSVFLGECILFFEFDLARGKFVESVKHGRYLVSDDVLPHVVVEFIELFDFLKQELSGRYQMGGGLTLHYDHRTCIEFNRKGTYKRIKDVGLMKEIYGEVMYEIDEEALSILKSKRVERNRALYLI